MLNLLARVTIRPVTPLPVVINREQIVGTMQKGTTRSGDIANVSLREMVAHLNVIEASIDTVGKTGKPEAALVARDVLSRLELLAFSAARLQIPEMPRVTDALEELVLALDVRRPRQDAEVSATLRHGVDVLMLLTHDKMRRIQGHPPAELKPAADALLDRVDRLIGNRAMIAPPALKIAGL